MLIEKKGDIWDDQYDEYWKVIPTNGDVNRFGLAIMGKGVALQAADKFPSLRKDLGVSLKTNGLGVKLYPDQRLIIFPVKYHWKYKASKRLIAISSKQLQRFITTTEMKIVMPRVGCGNGGLQWQSVQPVLQKYFSTITNEIIVLEYT